MPGQIPLTHNNPDDGLGTYTLPMDVDSVEVIFRRPSDQYTTVLMEGATLQLQELPADILAAMQTKGVVTATVYTALDAGDSPGNPYKIWIKKSSVQTVQPMDEQEGVLLVLTSVASLTVTNTLAQIITAVWG